jgi:hypothetical protein
LLHFTSIILSKMHSRHVTMFQRSILGLGNLLTSGNGNGFCFVEHDEMLVLTSLLFDFFCFGIRLTAPNYSTHCETRRARLISRQLMERKHQIFACRGASWKGFPILPGILHSIRTLSSAACVAFGATNRRMKKDSHTTF